MASVCSAVRSCSALGCDPMRGVGSGMISAKGDNRNRQRERQRQQDLC